MRHVAGPCRLVVVEVEVDRWLGSQFRLSVQGVLVEVVEASMHRTGRNPASGAETGMPCSGCDAEAGT